MKALIIEDDPHIIEIIRLCFTTLWPQSSVVSAENGQTALRLVETESPDIVILDLGLPDIDGMEVLKEIRMISQVPVMIVTALEEEISEVMGLEMGADGYLVKPFSHSEFTARVKAILHRSNASLLKSNA